MDLDIVPGTYVVAVSGGVDSMVLLHMLKDRPGLKLIVAHYDHGIRDDSAKDRQFVAQIAKEYKLPFIHDQGNLGADASENTARKARYKFLHTVRTASGARGIITAHHRDDALETAILHMLRGTGRRGLSSLQSRHTLERPLLTTSKSVLKDYAQSNGLVWREDSTNSNVKYMRNQVRHHLIPKLSSSQQEKMHEILGNMRAVNKEIDSILDLALHVQPSQTSINRSWFIGLPHNVSAELLTHWLRRQGIRGFDRRQIQKLTVAMKTLQPGHKINVNKTHNIEVKPKVLALVGSDR